jgi:hypothetical protein
VTGLGKRYKRILALAPEPEIVANRLCFQSGRDVAITAALPSGASLAERISV